MAIQLNPDQSQVLPSELPVEVTSAEGSLFYLISADQYGKVRALLSEDVDARSMYPQMARVFGEDGWNDPEMDVYDELDPRRDS